QAEALEVYRETRRLLRDELGLEPSPALRELERAILRQDPSLSPAAHEPLALDQERSRRRWLVYAPLAGAALLAAGGIAAFGAIRLGASAPRAASSATSIQTETREQTVSTRLELRGSHPETHGAPKKPSHRAETRHVATKLASTKAAQSRSASLSISHVQARQRSRKRPGVEKRPPTAPPAMLPTVDSFAGSTMNTRIWTRARWGTGVDVAQTNGRLQLTMHANATPDPRWNAMAGGYQTACTLTGDFDARVDYALLNWPASNGTVLA